MQVKRLIKDWMGVKGTTRGEGGIMEDYGGIVEDYGGIMEDYGGIVGVKRQIDKMTHE